METPDAHQTLCVAASGKPTMVCPHLPTVDLFGRACSDVISSTRTAFISPSPSSNSRFLASICQARRGHIHKPCTCDSLTRYRHTHLPISPLTACSITEIHVLFSWKDSIATRSVNQGFENGRGKCAAKVLWCDWTPSSKLGC